jgi:hypothetical protein
MNILKRLRNRSPAGTGDIDPVEAGTADEQRSASRYDHVADKKVVGQLPQLSQVELAEVETHERSHQDRSVVLNKLHWLKGSEPLPGYDALETEEIVQALGGADAETVKAVREYERHHQNRLVVRSEVARVLPTSPASAGEDRARDEKAARVRSGIAGRQG